MINISNEEYRKMDGVSSSVLKKILVSEAHLDYVINNGWQKTDATTLGDAIHAYLIEPERFNSMYTKEVELYKKATGRFVAGDPKLDEDGKPLTKYTHATDSSMDIKGEQYKKFEAMIKAVMECPEAMELLNNKFNVEKSFFGEYKGQAIKVRNDFMTVVDGKKWIVDIKTVGGQKDKPSNPDKFSYVMHEMNYDLQAYMYTELIKQEIEDIAGFIFLCIDAKVPSGVKIYKIIPGESEWYELGGYKFKDAMKRYAKFKETTRHPTYENVDGEELELSFNAADVLAMYRAKGE